MAKEPKIICSVPATLQERVSSRSGEVYTCIVIKIDDDIEKLVFLTPSEAKLIALGNN